MELVNEREVSIFSAFFGAIKRFFVVSREESNIKSIKCKMCCKTCGNKALMDVDGKVFMKCAKRYMLTVEADMVCPMYEVDQEIVA